jgi:hypothetical protein
MQTTKELEQLKEQYDLLLVNEESMGEETPQGFKEAADNYFRIDNKRNEIMEMQ